MWLQIFGIWTLAAMSMAIQVYLNGRLNHPEISFVSVLLKQIPHWYLWALLTPVVIYYSERYPLDTPDWKKNLRKQMVTALLLMMVFAHPWILAISIITGRSVHEMTAGQYIHAYFSVIAWDLAVYAFILAVVFADKANSKRKEKELMVANMELHNKELQNQLNQARLEALKLQLSPHFLFNTLNTVSSLIRSQEYATALKVNARLGNFLRTSLYAGETPFVSFAKELEFLDLYLSIESLRFSDRLQVEKKVKEDCLEVKVPYFILQPVIENAIKHGIAKQSSAKRIVVEASIDKSHLLICIYNEGKLLPENYVKEECWNIGLSNVYNRLKNFYADRFYFQIENHPEGKGVQAIYKIPKT